MDLTGSPRGVLDQALFGSAYLTSFYDIAKHNGMENFSSADRQFGEPDQSSTDEILMSLNRVINIDTIRDTRKAPLRARSRIIGLDAQNPGSWGQSTLINETAMQTFLKNQFIEVKLSDVSTMPVNLPNLKVHLGLTSASEAIVAIRNSNGTAISALDEYF